MTITNPLTKAAQDAVTKSKDVPTSSNDHAISIAKHFFTKTCTPILLSSSPPVFTDPDRLTKAGRRIIDILSLTTTSTVESSLSDLLATTTLLTAAPLPHVPKIRFGKTNLSMPIATLGGMRLQQAWGPSITSMSQVSPECQANLITIIRRAIEMGINHIETAGMYGCSELQYGAALDELFSSGEVKREDLIIQTKNAPSFDASSFRKKMEQSFERLQLSYIDLFAFHGVNTEKEYDMIFSKRSDGGENCWDVVQDFVSRGKIRNVGFSTHGTSSLIKRCVLTDKFDYVNLHYHFCGSYTATGQGPDGGGNYENVKLMNDRDMGVFVISPYDKGGRLYAPSRKLRSLTLPEMDPITFGSSWLWQHHRFNGGVKVHTIVCGAARASDLDEVYTAAVRHGMDKEGVAKKLDVVRQRLEEEKERILGKEWLKNWHVGLKTVEDNEFGINFPQLIGLYNGIRAFGLVQYAKERYNPAEGYLEKWDFDKTFEENVQNMGWSWTPGCAPKIGMDYKDCFENCPEDNKEKLVKALEYLHRVCTKNKQTREVDDEKKIEEDQENEKHGYEDAYDLRPWTAFPERKS